MMAKRKNIFLLTTIFFFVFIFSCNIVKIPFAHNTGNIVVYGDSRSGHSEHRRIVDAMTFLKPMAVFHTGDLVADGNNPSHWLIFNSITNVLLSTADIYPVLGNHEDNSPLYYNNFSLPNNEQWYSVNINGIHFICLDSNLDNPTFLTQYQWLVDDLSGLANGNIKFIILLFHHPIITTGFHPGKTGELREKLLPICDMYNVDVVFNGHNHNYERSLYRNTYHITTGGGGAPLYNQARIDRNSQVFRSVFHFCRLYRDENNLIIEVWNNNRDIIDVVKIKVKR